jgi:hypothetical protein
MLRSAFFITSVRRATRAEACCDLPREPGHPTFEAAYLAAIEGRPVPQPAAVINLPSAIVPRSFKAAWRLLRTEDPEWRALGSDIKGAQTNIIERFLTMPVVEGEPLTFGQVEVAFMKRKHVKALLAHKSATPHAAAHLLRVIRKLIGVALDQECILRQTMSPTRSGRIFLI